MSTMWKEITDILHMDPANSDLAAPPSARRQEQQPLEPDALTQPNVLGKCSGLQICRLYLLWSHAVWFAVTRAVFMLSDVVLE